MDAERFGPRLRSLREAAGLTQQQLADLVGVKWESVSRWERGTREPSWGNVLALGKALGVPCTAFQVEEGAQASEAPAESHRKPGRPRKATPEPPGEEPAPKKGAKGRKKT
jgi:transcriptional regulator with XRE-family HTH domain